jgi:hypothetical protein
MKAELQQFGTPQSVGQRSFPLGTLTLLLLGVPLGLWWFYSQLAGGSSEFARFEWMAACFLILAMAYLGLHGVGKMAWTSLPVLLTFEALAGFVVVPVWQFATGADSLDGSYDLAMFLVLVAFAAFWLGSILLMKESGVRFAPTVSYTSSRVLMASSVMLVLGVVGNVVLWRIGLFGYTGDATARASYSGVLAWITFMCDLLKYAVVVSAIEVFGKRSPGRAIKVVFWLSLLFAVGFGVLSGMKSGPLYPLADVALIYAIIRRRIPRTAFLLPLLLVVFIYPFTSAFRDNLNSGYSAQFNTLGGMEATLTKSFDDAFLSFGATSRGAANQNLQDATSRVSYLTYVRDVSSLPVPSMLHGDEKLWMAPLYPLVPRFLWKSKPVLNEGHRLSILLGHGSTNSSAPTPIGDLYSLYGAWGVAFGMFIWGVFVQLCMNWVGSKPASERMLFVYVFMLGPLLNLENDFTGMIAAAVQMAILVLVASYVIYGARSASTKLPDRRYSSQAGASSFNPTGA